MPEKVKRGLGLLVVAVIAFVVGAVAQTGESTGPQMVAVLAGAVVIACGVIGLVMVAWGLLRD